MEVGEPTQAGERAVSRAEHGWGTSTYIHLRVRYLVLGPMWEAMVVPWPEGPQGSREVGSGEQARPDDPDWNESRHLGMGCDSDLARVFFLVVNPRL